MSMLGLLSMSATNYHTVYTDCINTVGKYCRPTKIKDDVRSQFILNDSSRTKG